MHTILTQVLGPKPFRLCVHKSHRVPCACLRKGSKPIKYERTLRSALEELRSTSYVKNCRKPFGTFIFTAVAVAVAVAVVTAVAVAAAAVALFFARLRNDHGRLALLALTPESTASAAAAAAAAGSAFVAGSQQSAHEYAFRA